MASIAHYGTATARNALPHSVARESRVALVPCCCVVQRTKALSMQFPARRLQAKATLATTKQEQQSKVITTPKGLEVRETQPDQNSRVKLRVVVPAKLCKELYDETLLEYNKKVKVKGFRPGKVPEWMLLSHVGQKRVEADAVKLILDKTLPEAMASVAGRALKDSEQIETKFDALLASFIPSSPLSYTVAVDVIPEVRWITENAYKNLTIQVQARDEAALRSAADAEFASRLKDLGSLRVVTDRGIQMKDVTIVDVSAVRINSDGTEGDKLLSCQQKGFSLDTEEHGSYIPGLVDGLIGLERNQSRSFELVFPPDWNQEHLRGIKALFTVECKEIFRRVLPELNDEIADRLYEGCNTLDEVKEALFNKHQHLEEESRKTAAKAAIVQELSKIADIDVPTSLLEDQGRQMYAAKLFELQVAGKFDTSQMGPMTTKEMVDNFLRVKRDEILAAVKQSIAVAEIFKLEKLEYSDEELDREMKVAIAEFDRYKQEYDVQKVKEQAQEMLEGSKVLEWLYEHANIQYTFNK